jgi:hypothetical protein
MDRLKRWRGLRALFEDAVEHGSRAVERVHLATARRPFGLIERIPGIAEPGHLVHEVHDLTVQTVYSSVRLVNRAVGAALDLTLDVIESARQEPAQPPSDAVTPPTSE